MRALLKVKSMASSAPWWSGRPEAKTSIDRSSDAETMTFMSLNLALHRTIAPASLQMRANVLSGGTARVRRPDQVQCMLVVELHMRKITWTLECQCANIIDFNAQVVLETPAPPCPGCASTMQLQQMTNKTFGCSRFPLCKRVVRHTTYYGITCFTVCALVFGGTALGGANNDGGLRFGRLGRSRINTRTAILVATTTAAFVFWYHGSASTQGDHSDVSRPIAEEHGELCGPDVAVHDAGRIDNTEVLQRARLWNHETAANADPWEAAVRNFPFVSVSLASLWKLTRDVHNRRCLTILFSESP